MARTTEVHETRSVVLQGDGGDKRIEEEGRRQAIYARVQASEGIKAQDSRTLVREETPTVGVETIESHYINKNYERPFSMEHTFHVIRSFGCLRALLKCSPYRSDFIKRAHMII